MAGRPPLLRGPDSLWNKHKYGFLIGVLLVTLVVGWFASPHIARYYTEPSRFCPLPKGSYRYVRVYRGHGALEAMMFLSPYRDAVSEAVAAHAAAETSVMPTKLYHDFYQKELCNGKAVGKCPGLVVDVGAHLGTHAIFLAQLGLEVHAFEPFKSTADLLRCSVAANGLRNMRVLQQGVSNANEIECILHPTGDRQDMAMFMPKKRTGGGARQCTTETAVQMVTLDTYWETVLEKRPIDLVKVDVEGHEQYVLEGAAKLLAEAPPRLILIEYFPSGMSLKNQDPKLYFSAIRAAKYRVYDCQQKVEVKAGAEGELLARYQAGATDLLLLRGQDFPNATALPQLQCGY